MNIIKIRWILALPSFFLAVIVLAYVQLWIEQYLFANGLGRHAKSHHEELEPDAPLIHPEHVDKEPVVIEEYAMIAGFEIFYRTVIPDKSEANFDPADSSVYKKSKIESKSEAVKQLLNFPRVVLLLHGLKFTSQTWMDIGTLHDIAQKTGVPAVAIDLPGYGKSRKVGKLSSPKSTELSAQQINDFMTQIPIVLGFPNSKIILLAPSMAGMYAFPWLVESEKQGLLKENFEGFIAIAPIGIEEHRKYLKKIEVPTLILYGDQDDIGRTTAKVLKRNLHDFREITIPNGSHACYLDDSVLFNYEIANFVEYLIMKARQIYHMKIHH